MSSGRPVAIIELTAEERSKLEELARRRKTSQAMALRSRIILDCAGGLTNTAYPYGTVFLRKSAASAEHDGYIRAANEIENSLVNAMTRIGNDKIDPSAFASLQSFVNELRNQKAVGRISIAADPSVLAARPELDPLLEAGDMVYIPQRPSTISVLGQVSQPGSFPYRANLSPEDYVRMAGGYAAVEGGTDPVGEKAPVNIDSSHLYRIRVIVPLGAATGTTTADAQAQAAASAAAAAASRSRS